ncbi:MAG: fibronectin type III domain-containing protein [Candidatus Zhuqueibacterota bacterium]
MKSRHFFLFTILILLTLFNSCARLFKTTADYQAWKKQNLTAEALKRVNACLAENMSGDARGPIPIHSKADSLFIDQEELDLTIYLSKHFSFQPFRDDQNAAIYRLFERYLGRKFKNFSIHLVTITEPIENLVPNFYRQDTLAWDLSRMPISPQPQSTPIFYSPSRENRLPQRGLFNRHIVIRHSHGYYYSNENDRWEWQRPRLFTTVEDLLPTAFVLPYVTPMLENAGAVVFLCRERDIQTHEVIVDNDSSTAGEYREVEARQWQRGASAGFAIGQRPYPVNYNPFAHGSHRFCLSESTATARAEWIPDIPETGDYSVQIAYTASELHAPDARYSVYHSGGRTDFVVNQQMAGNTWLYLGQFKFEKGFNPANGKVTIENRSAHPGKIISADAVRFGGGMGNIVRGGCVSGYPRFAEGARYYLQYAGMPDSLVYNFHADSNDYNDDYMGRSEFVNYLKGDPCGPNANRDIDGLNIPIDATLSFHTDAGIGDSTIGTLMIYSVPDVNSSALFPDGMSRLANRDLADILQTQLVEDIRSRYRPDWSRRALMNADYAEAKRPNVPSCLLELLSHQNFIDMQYALSPQFRFDVSRAIYKGMLKFLSAQYRADYVVQPLPVSHVHSFFSDSAEVTLRWRPVHDPLEPSAAPQKYVVYTRIENSGFDNGTVVDSAGFTLGPLKKGVIYSFKVTAINDGGESFPSEILSVCWNENPRQPVLIVNGFDRIAPPQWIDEPNFKGFARFIDPGVPDRFEFNFTGAQYDFSPASKFRSNDGPGFGASQANLETRLIPGNSFDFPMIHGRAIRNYGASFICASDEAVMEHCLDIGRYTMVDLILGEEKTSPFPMDSLESASRKPWDFNYQTFPAPLQNCLQSFCESGGCLFVSGAFVGSDLARSPHAADRLFAQYTLHFQWQTDFAAATGRVFCADSLIAPRFSEFQFNTGRVSGLYPVESSDAIDPVNGATTLLRYAENKFSAGIHYSGVSTLFVLGFPFESIIEETWRNKMMSAILDTFMASRRANSSTH